MAKIISASIDLTKIDKSKIIDGKKGKYYNLDITVNDDKDQYGNDVSISTSLTKEERTSKVKRTYLGNGKIVWTNESTTAPTTTVTPTSGSPSPQDDGLPF